MPVDRNGTPLGMLPEFDGNLDAMAWLWKDHSGYAEAEEITALAAKMRPAYLGKCGGHTRASGFGARFCTVSGRPGMCFGPRTVLRNAATTSRRCWPEIRARID